jgi:hypothetical protein
MSLNPLGWINFDDRTDEQNSVHALAIARMPYFNLPFQGTPEVGTKVILTDLWRHEKVKAALGFEFPGWHQFTGSCVGVGGGNGAQTLNFKEALISNEPEKIVLLFWPYNYGRSRLKAGMHGRGEGSLGSTFAASLAGDGITRWEVDGVNLPKHSINGQIEIGAQQELAWSDGAVAPGPVRDEAIQHKIISAPLSTFTQVRDAILNGYPVLRAFMKFAEPNTAKVRNGVLIGSYNGTGGHQESWLGYWNHPQEGELIYEMNQWGQNVYGKDPGGGALGGCWIRDEEVNRQCANGEIYALSSYDGYPAQPEFYDWMKQSFFS